MLEYDGNRPYFVKLINVDTCLTLSIEEAMKLMSVCFVNVRRSRFGGGGATAVAAEAEDSVDSDVGGSVGGGVGQNFSLRASSPCLFTKGTPLSNHCPKSNLFLARNFMAPGLV